MKRTLDYYYSDVAREVEFGSEEDQEAFDDELQKLISDDNREKTKELFMKWLNDHDELNGIFIQNGDFNHSCMRDFPFEDLMDAADNANGYIGFDGLDDDMDRWAVSFFLNLYGISL